MLVRIRLHLVRERALAGLARLAGPKASGLPRDDPDVRDVVVQQRRHAERREKRLKELRDRHRRRELQCRVDLRVNDRAKPVASIDVHDRTGLAGADLNLVDNARRLGQAVDLDDDLGPWNERRDVFLRQFVLVEVEPELRARCEVVLVELVREEVRIRATHIREQDLDAREVRIIERRVGAGPERDLRNRLRHQAAVDWSAKKRTTVPCRTIGLCTRSGFRRMSDSMSAGMTEASWPIVESFVTV